MDQIFRKHCAYIGVFFDDVIIYLKTLDEHKDHLRKIFKELCDHKLYINAKKSEFFLQEMALSGHNISKEGIRMDLQKLKVIKEWPNPKNLYNLRSFLDICSY